MSYNIYENAHIIPIWPGEQIESNNMQYSVHNFWMQQVNVLPYIMQYAHVLPLLNMEYEYTSVMLMVAMVTMASVSYVLEICINGQFNLL